MNQHCVFVFPLVGVIVQAATPGITEIVADDKKVLFYGVGAILMAMTSAFALLWRAYQSQIEARQSDYKDVVVILKAIEAQGSAIQIQVSRILDKFNDVTDKIETINNKVDRRPQR